MYIQKMSLKEFGYSLAEAISIGKKNYLVLVICSAIVAGVNLVLTTSTFGKILSPVFSVIWTVGIIYMAQAIIERNQEPKVSQFFIAFSKNSLLKTIVPNLIIILIFTVIETILLVSLGIVLYFVAKNSTLSPSDPSHLAAASVAIGATAILLMLPLMFVPHLLVLQKYDWKESLKLSIIGTLKNKTISFAIVLPTLLYLAFTVFVLISPDFFKDGGPKITPESLGVSSNIFQLVTLLSAPFFMMLTYILYKRIFVSDKFDANLELAN